MKSKIFALIGFLIGIFLFTNEKAKEFIGLTFVEYSIGLKLKNVQSDGQIPEHYLVPTSSISLDNKGRHFVYRVRGNLLDLPKEEFVVVKKVKDSGDNTTVSSNELQVGDRVVISMEKQSNL